MELIRERIFSVVCLCLTVSFVIGEPVVVPECVKESCPGPLQFYKDFGCQPVYKNDGDCCAYKYDCEHLKNRSTDKCYINGNEYNIGESLRKEDAGVCNIACSCRERAGRAEFSCAAVDCPGNPDPSCYTRWTADSCCGDVICPKTPNDRPTCEVDGTIYLDGHQFTPKDEPDKVCFCSANYTGKNVEPFCRPVDGCRSDLHYPHTIINKCAPTYYPGQTPQTSCNLDYRCQNQWDEVMKLAKSADAEDSDAVCYLGNLTMQVGDELKQATDYSSVCVRCVCEVGPLPTCVRLSECDVTDHPDFRNRKN